LARQGLKEVEQAAWLASLADRKSNDRPMMISLNSPGRGETLKTPA
jgi:hypothetical protein